MLKIKNTTKAFTIIEAIVTIVIFTLAMGAVMGGILMLYKTQDFTFQQAIAINDARKGIETMIKEIREARQGDDGSYPIEYAGDKEFIFYSDIDKDGATERVRYFLGNINSGSQVKECVTFVSGGSCSVTFSNFLSGTLQSAEVTVSVEGDFGAGNEYADIYADGTSLGNVCKSGCSDCAGAWQGTTVFDVTSEAQDGSIQFTADASNRVNAFCDWQDPNHSMKARFELKWTEVLSGGQSVFKKGVIEPTGQPVQYSLDQEVVTVITPYVRNTPPIFHYYDAAGQELLDLPARLKDTKRMRVYLVVNVNPNRPPKDFELQSGVELRNLKYLE